FGQPEWRVGEAESPLRAIKKIGLAIQTFAFLAGGKNRNESPSLLSDDAPAALLADREPAFFVERPTLPARLAVFSDFGPGVTAVGPINAHLPIGRPAVNRIGVRVAEKKVAL